MNRWVALCAVLPMLAVACGSSKVNYVDPDELSGDLEVPWDDVLNPDLTGADQADNDIKNPGDTEETPDGTTEVDATGDTLPVDLADQTDGDTTDTQVDPDTDQPDLGDTVEPDEIEEVIEPPVDDLTVSQRPTTAPWESIELLEFSHPALSGEKFTDKTKQTDPTITGWFEGENAPSAGTVVLHVGPGCKQSPTQAVLLVHGAGSNAQQSWIDPDFLGGGMGAQWIEAGKCVFAVTFPHMFGDNRNQAVQLAAALYEARVLSGLPQIHVVAHSKGGIVALAYATGFVASTGLAYEGDIQTLTLVAVPMGGTDFSFRHPAFNYPADLMGLYMPSSWDQIMEYGSFKDILNDSIYGGAFQGVLQLTVAWDEVYDLAMMEQDWYTTYYGGTGFVSHSPGITEAIALSGNFMENLRKGKTPADLPCHIVSGGLQTVGATPWEYTGPSDAMVFEASAQDETMLGSVAASEHYSLLNHWDLLSSSSVREWVEELVF